MRSKQLVRATLFGTVLVIAGGGCGGNGALPAGMTGTAQGSCSHDGADGYYCDESNGLTNLDLSQERSVCTNNADAVWRENTACTRSNGLGACRVRVANSPSGTVDTWMYPGSTYRGISVSVLSDARNACGTGQTFITAP
jgi:hypothetical protein